MGFSLFCLHFDRRLLIETPLFEFLKQTVLLELPFEEFQCLFEVITAYSYLQSLYLLPLSLKKKTAVSKVLAAFYLTKTSNLVILHESNENVNLIIKTPQGYVRYLLPSSSHSSHETVKSPLKTDCRVNGKSLWSEKVFA